MRRVVPLLLGLTLGAMFLLPSFMAVAIAADSDDSSILGVRKPLLNAPRYRSGFSTAAASTVWYGFLASSTDPNKVHVDGK